MYGMSIQERYADISRISGLSEEIVKRVLDAELQSVIGTLKKGQRTAIIGKCVITPMMKLELGASGKSVYRTKLKAEASSNLQRLMELVEVDQENEGESLRLNHIATAHVGGL